MLHKIIALDSFEEPSWHTTTVSGFPDSGFSSGETQLQMEGFESPRLLSHSREQTDESWS